MRIAEGKGFAILEWGLLIGLTAAAILISEASGLRAEWEDVMVLTVVVFAVLITSLRSAWGLVAFWRYLALFFAAHVLVILVTMQVLPERRFGIPKLLLTAAGVAETFFIGAMLWKKTAREKSHKGAGPRSWNNPGTGR
jgi:hypothetical protein